MSPRKLSATQLYVLDIATRYKLQRSSMGWWAVDHRGMAPGSSSLKTPSKFSHGHYQIALAPRSAGRESKPIHPRQ